MGLSPRIVTEDVVFRWDGVTQRLPKGQVMDVPPGSALERAIGLDHLVPLGAVTAQPPAQEAAAKEEPKSAPKEEPKLAPTVADAAPAKPAPAKAKDATDAKDGES